MSKYMSKSTGVKINKNKEVAVMVEKNKKHIIMTATSTTISVLSASPFIKIYANDMQRHINNANN